MSTNACRGAFNVARPSVFRTRNHGICLTTRVGGRIDGPMTAVNNLASPTVVRSVVTSKGTSVICVTQRLLTSPRAPRGVVRNQSTSVIRYLHYFAYVTRQTTATAHHYAIGPLVNQRLSKARVRPTPVGGGILIINTNPNNLCTTCATTHHNRRIVLYRGRDRINNVLGDRRTVPFGQRVCRLKGACRQLTHRTNIRVHLGARMAPTCTTGRGPRTLVVTTKSHPLIPPVGNLSNSGIVVIGRCCGRGTGIKGRIVIFNNNLTNYRYTVRLNRRNGRIRLVRVHPALTPSTGVHRHPLLLTRVRGCIRIRASCGNLRIAPRNILYRSPRNRHILIPNSAIVYTLNRQSHASIMRTLRSDTPFIHIVNSTTGMSAVAGTIC